MLVMIYVCVFVLHLQGIYNTWLEAYPIVKKVDSFFNI